MVIDAIYIRMKNNPHMNDGQIDIPAFTTKQTRYNLSHQKEFNPDGLVQNGPARVDGPFSTALNLPSSYASMLSLRFGEQPFRLHTFHLTGRAGSVDFQFECF